MHTLRLLCVALFTGPWSSNFSTLPSVVGFRQVSPTASRIVYSPDVQTTTTTTTSCQAVSSPESHVSKGSLFRQKFKQSIESSKLETYHLIWSTGAWKKLIVGTLSLFSVNTLFKMYPRVNVFSNGLEWMAQSKFIPLSTFASNVILPLMASACCLLQLWINLLAGGCAGFNTILGPVRPYFLSVLLYISLTTAQWNSGKWYFRTLARWMVALSPEFLHLWNVFNENNRHQSSSTTSTIPVTNMPFQATLKLDIPTMGCVACINKINSALKENGRILEAHSELNPLGAKGGHATVRVASQTRDELDQLFEAIVESIENAGFEPCRIESIEFHKAQGSSQM